MNYEEIYFSQTALDNGILNRPSSVEIIRNIQYLLDVLRAMEKLLGVTIHVNSGYRCPELNALVGGAENSYHLYGLAADLRVENTPRCTMQDLKDLCRELRKTRFAEVIVHDTYVHVAIKPYY